MATASVSKEALEVLQQYGIDLKDFTKARACYATIVQKELVSKAEGEGTEGVPESTKTLKEQVRVAWEEYIFSVQQYFRRTVRSILGTLVDVGSPLSTLSGANSATSDGVATAISKDCWEANTSPLATTHGAGSSDSVSLSRNVNVLSVPMVSSGCGVGGEPLTQFSSGAERISDFCVFCEKWYINNESVLDLPEPEAIVALTASSLASVSRLLRLLGMRMAYVCAGNSYFLRGFTENGEAVRYAALCGDRGLNGEVDALLSLMDRLVQLNIADPTAYPEVPFGWLYRLSSFLEHPDAIASASPKRRSIAVRIALQLLRHRPNQATAAGLHSILLNACIESSGCVTPDEAQQVIRTVLVLFDAPSTRQYLKMTDIRAIFAPFLSTAESGGAALLAKQNNAKELIVTVFCTWVGSLWISSEVTGLRSIVDVLHLPGSLDTKMVIITLFNKLLTRLAPHRGIVPMDTWKGLEEDRLLKAARDADEVQAMEVDGKGSAPTDMQYLNNSFVCDVMLTHSSGETVLSDDFIPTTKALGYHVMDPLLGRVLVCLNYHGLPYALTRLMQVGNKNRVLTTAASRLLQDIFVLMDTVVPQVIVFKLHEAFNKAVGCLTKDGNLFVGGFTSQLFRNYKKSSYASEEGAMVPSNTTQMPNAFLSTPGTLDVDDPTFVTMLQECKVDRMRDSHTWNFDIVVALVQGPLHLPRRFRAARELVETLVLFFTPSSRSNRPPIRTTFSTLPPESVAPQVCMVGVELIDLILSSRDGAVLLERMGFVAAVAAMLKEVRIGKPVVLRRSVVNTRIGQSLLRITGRLSAHANGLLLMRDHSIFSLVDSMFSKLKGPRLESASEEDTLHDVCRQLLQYLYLGAVPNYGVCKDIRHTFRAALGNPSNAIRLCAAQQLKKAVWRDLSTSMRWGIETLLQALHDDFFGVVESAFKLLLSICLSSNEGLDYLIECFPTVLMESEVILNHAEQLRLNVLLYRIASRPSGFSFLQCYGWVEKELHRWEESESVQYTIMVERLQGNGGGADAPAAPGAGVTAATPGFRGGASSMFMTSNSDLSFRYAQSYSDSVGGMYNRNSGKTSYLPLLTAEAVSSTKFFPVHYASVLCSSAEGCAMFKHSRLWTRSVQRLLEQPLPPDIVYDDSVSDEDDTSSDGTSDGDLGMMTDAALYMNQQQVFHHQEQRVGMETRMTHGNGNGTVGVGGTSVSALGTFANSANASRYSAPGDCSGYSFGVGRGRDGLYGGLETSIGDKNAEDGTEGSTGAAGAHLNGGLGGVDQSNIATAKQIEMLKRGYLSPPSSRIISASRFCKSFGKSFSLDCVGDILALKDAILCVAEVGSTEVGYGMMLSVPGLHRRFIALSRFASTISVRCVGLLGSAILARSRRGCDDLMKKGHLVLLNPNAYVSAEGIPYSVSFAQMKPSKWISIARKISLKNTNSRHAHADSKCFVSTQGMPQRILNNLYALSNPVSCESAKKILYRVMKRRPQLFLQPQMRLLCLDIAYTYRMHYKERRFLADLLDNAQITAAPSIKLSPARSLGRT